MTTPSFIQFYPTLRCNQRCKFCFNKKVSVPFLSKDMDKQDAFTIGNKLRKIGVQEIDILGGEPFLVSWIKDFAQYITDSGITINISTNGSLPGIVNEFTKIQTDLLNIGFSLQGLSKTHNFLTSGDNFSKAILGIKELIDKGSNPVVKSILMQENKNEICKLIYYLKEIGIKRYYLLHEDIIGREQANCFSFPQFWEFYSRSKERLNGILDIGFVAASAFYKYGLLAEGRCDAGITKIAVLPDGSAYPCNLLFGFHEFFLGNIIKEDIEKIWENPILDIFRSKIKNRCAIASCEHYANCTGGCPAHCYYFFGSFHSSDPRCKRKHFSC